MPRAPQIEPLGELETTVMTVVWASSSVTARETCDRLTGDLERAYTTIMTTLDRLHRKGLLHREKDGQAWRYTAVLDRAEFERALADRLAGQIVGTHGEAGLVAFVDAAARDPGLLDRLAQLVEQRRQRP